MAIRRIGWTIYHCVFLRSIFFSRQPSRHPPFKLRYVAKPLPIVAKDGAILATNTSFLDIAEIAAVTRHPERVVGMHFFSPANVMRLLEVVRTSSTDLKVIKAVLDIGARIGKIAVLVGNCYGFVGNRIVVQRKGRSSGD